MNKIARTVTLKEGGKVNQPIAQVKETIRLFCIELKKFKTNEVVNLLKRY